MTPSRTGGGSVWALTTTAQERQTLQGRDGGSTGPQRSIADIDVPGSCALETMERLPTPKPRRDENATCVKLLGQRLSAREFDRQVAEFQIRIAVLNGFTALGIPVTEAVG